MVLIAVGLSTSVYAQAIKATSGNIYGKAVDETGGVLPGVTITLSGVGAPRTATTGTQGEFRFVNMEPGTYQIKADLSGFASVDMTNVRVGTGSNTDLTIPMKLSSVAATVTVSGEVPLLDVHKERTGSNFSQEELKNIPTSRDPWGILQLSAGVLTDNVVTGSNNNGQQTVFVGKGTNFTNNAWNIDGMSVTDLAAVGASPSYYDFDAFQEMQATTGGPDPSIVTPGVTLNMVTKRGTNDAHGSARVYDTPQETEAFNHNAEAESDGLTSNRINKVQDYGVEVGGPIWRDRIWAWGAFGHTDVKTTTAARTQDNTQLEDYNAKINAQPVESNSLSFFYFRGDKTKQGRGTTTLRPAETGWNQSGPSHFERVEDSQVFGPSVFGTVSYSFANTPFNLDPAGGTAVDVYRDAARVWHNSYYTDHNVRPQHNVQGTGSFFFNTGTVGNELKLGASYIQYSSRHSRAWPGSGDYGDERTIASHDPAFPFTANITRADIDGQDVRTIGAFLGDTITAGSLTLNLGVRYDSFYGHNVPSNVAANANFPDLLPALNYPGGGSEFRSNRFEPRLGITYALGPQRTTLLRASYARFADQLGTSTVSADNPLGVPARAQYQWNDLNHDHRIQRNELCTTCPVNPIGFDPNDPGNAFSPNRVASGLKAPTTDEFIVGVEQQLLPELVAGANYTYRKRKDFIWNCPLALDNSTRCISNSDYRLFNSGEVGSDKFGNVITSGPLYYVPGIDPNTYSFGNLESNRPDYSTNYNGVEFQVQKRLANKWSMNASVNLMSWKQKVSNVATGCIDPTNQVDVVTVRGNTCGSGDIAYDYNGTTWINAKWSFALSGLYQLPLNFNVSASVFGHQGYPVPYYITDDPGDGLGQRTVAAGAADAHRLKNVYEADMAIQKVIPFAGKAEITLSLNVFNVFNSSTILFRQSDATDGVAASVSTIQNPRVLQFGARVSF